MKQKERRLRARALLRALKKLFPTQEHALTELTHWKNPWELLVAVILSAQCTDKRVNIVTEKLFKKYKKSTDYAHARQQDFEKDIASINFFRAKTKNIIASAQKIITEYNGVVPETMHELITLPGVARKTANVVLGNAFGKTEGIAVDTHVKRFAIRYGLTDEKTPEKIEQDLMKLFPKKDWFLVSNLMIQYGRQIAPARKYDISKDPLIKIYPPAGEFFRV
ncbi:MAG: endonuclease III [Candidatus Pacebacteria bacterium]|nr:endonuclease III [Candidatus Paceibacterota bacterium]